MTVVGIGQCCWDLVAMIDRYPESDEKEEIRHLAGQGGGPTATTLVTLARLGIPCRFHGIVGTDGYAPLIRESLFREGIDISGIITRSGASQVAFIAVQRDNANRTIFWQRPAGAPLLPAELPDDVLAGAAALHLDGLMPEVSRFALEQARHRGIPVMLDAGRLRPGMRELAQRCDYLVGAERFFRDIGWDGSAEQFQEIAGNIGAPVVTVTLGARGSMTWSHGNFFTTPAFTTPVVDTTGAGDAFHGGYLYGVVQGWELQKTVTFASAVAAMKCRTLGGRDGLPSLPDVEQFLAQHGHT